MRQGLAVACACALLVACARARVPQAPTRDARPASAILPTPAKAPAPRLFPPTRGAGIVEAGVDHDGSRRLLALGLRVVEHPDGSLEVGDELLPAARSARFLELPERLGGGFLFWIVTSSATLLYRARGWTAQLEPVAQLDFEVERLVPGFDRLLLLPRRDADYRALDLESGSPVPPLGLPVAPSYGNMAFVDGWFGAVQVPLRGVLLSFDAGASWHPLALPVTAFEASGAALALTTPTAAYALDARGVLSHVADRDEAKVSEAARAELARVVGKVGVAERGAPPLLEIAALTGFPDGRGGAFVATGGSLLRLDLATGRVSERRERAYAGAGECQGVRLGATGVGFVCGQAQELTRLYRVTQPLGLEPVLELPGARVVSDSGSGGLVIHGACVRPADKLGATGTPHCVLPPSGAPFEVRTFTERDRVVALADGRAVVVTPPDRRTGGSLRIEGPTGSTTVPFQNLRQEPRQKKLLEQGVWLDGMVESKAGVLSGWVVGAGPFAGVELGLDGKLTLRRIQDDASHTLFAGPRALVLGENGLAQESTDAGAEWQGVELPPELDLKSRTAAGAKQGCTALGCAFAGMTRIGYFAGRSARSLAAPATPPRVSFPGPGGSRWLLRCAASGEVSAASLPARPPRSSTIRGLRAATLAPGDEPELPPLSPLLDQAPPVLSDGQQGVDAGTEPYSIIQTRIYAYGPRGGDWTKTGSLSISFADRFSVKAGVRVTAAGRSPWPDAASAADALGAEPSTSSAGFAGALDPSGSAGALLLNSRGSVDLFVFEAGRVPLRIANVGRYGMAARFSGVVRTKAGFFLGSYDENSRAFRIYRVVGQELDVVLEVTDIPSVRGPSAEVVRTAAGDALGIWVRGTGWFVHPIDLESRTVDAPYQVTPAQLSTIPGACESGAEGFVLSGPITPDPYAEVPIGMTGRSFEGRFRVSATSVCLDALAAQGEAGTNATPRSTATSVAALRATGRPTVALTLAERKPLGRRLGLVCSN